MSDSSESGGAGAGVGAAIQEAHQKSLEAIRREMRAELAAQRRRGKVDTSWKAAFKAVGTELVEMPLLLLKK